MLHNRQVAVLTLLLTTAACGEREFAPPTPTDGRRVELIVHSKPNQKLEMIQGYLLGWSAEWVTVKRTDGRVSHFASSIVTSVHEAKSK